MEMIREYHVGIDLGWSQDYTAVAIVEKLTSVDPLRRFVSDCSEVNVLGLKRFDLKTAYPEIVRTVSERLSQTPFSDGSPTKRGRAQSKYPVFLIVDATGVGKPVLDLFKEDDFLSRRVDVIGISITGGRSVSQSIGVGFNVPKRDLILALQVELQARRLKIASRIPDAETLQSEMRNFEMRYTAKANDIYGASSASHDDLVVATAMAVWSTKRFDGEVDPLGVLSRAMSKRYSLRSIY